jgi:hypothetical protein
MSLDTRVRRAAQGIHRAVEMKETSMRRIERDQIDRFDRFRRRRDRNRAIGAIVLVGAIAALAFAAAWKMDPDVTPVRPADQQVTPVPKNVGTVTITKAGSTLDGASHVGAGAFTLTVRNENAGPRQIVAFNVGNDQRFARFVGYVARVSAGDAQFQADRMDSFHVGGQIITDVDGRDAVTVSGTLAPGTYVIWCGSVSMATDPYWPMANSRPTDFIGPIEVR